MGLKAKRKSTPGRRRIEFKLDRPEAQTVSLAADFNNWDLKAHPMRRSQNGVWTKVVMVFPGQYEYRFYVDGQWFNDPLNPTRSVNTFGTYNNILVVSP